MSENIVPGLKQSLIQLIEHLCNENIIKNIITTLIEFIFILIFSPVFIYFFNKTFQETPTSINESSSLTTILFHK